MRSLAAVAPAVKKPFSLEYIDVPEPANDEVLVRISAVGICHTDLSSKDGVLPAPYPSVFGHEGAGVVEKVGPAVKDITPGDHVVLCPASCGVCPLCLSGEPMYCQDFFQLNFQTDPNGKKAGCDAGHQVFIKYFGQSSLSQYALASSRNTVRIRKDVPLNLMGPLGCGIQTGAGTVMNGMKAHPGSSIAVLGTGSVGLASVLGAAVCGCTTIIAIDLMPSRLEVGMSLGATHAINTKNDPDLAKAIRAIVPMGVNYIVDAAGVPSLVTAAFGALANRGILGLVAVPPSPDKNLEVPWLPGLLQGHVVQGFIEGHGIPKIFIPQLVDLYAQGRFPFDKMITLYPFAKINDAVEDQLTGRVIKPVLELTF
jgi:aryl-alcohol dehydrogenase